MKSKTYQNKFVKACIHKEIRPPMRFFIFQKKIKLAETISDIAVVTVTFLAEFLNDGFNHRRVGIAKFDSLPIFLRIQYIF